MTCHNVYIEVDSLKIYVGKTFYLCQVTCWFWNPERLWRNVSTCRSGWRVCQSYYHQPSADVSVPTQKISSLGLVTFYLFFCLFVERNEYSARTHAFKWSKSDRKDIYNFILFLLHNFLFVKESLEKRITLSTKILRIFLSTKSAYWNGFEGSCDTEDWSNDADNSITGQ